MPPSVALGTVSLSDLPSVVQSGGVMVGGRYLGSRSEWIDLPKTADRAAMAWLAVEHSFACRNANGVFTEQISERQPDGVREYKTPYEEGAMYLCVGVTVYVNQKTKIASLQVETGKMFKILPK